MSGAHPHPFIWISTPAQRLAFPISLALTLVLGAVLRLLDAPLRTLAAPRHLYDKNR